MDGADLRALAKEREARRAASGADVRSASPAKTKSSGGPLPWGRPAAAAGGSAASAAPAQLMSAHRSIRLARMFGVGANLLALLLLVFGFGIRSYTFLFFFLGGIGLARGGGRLVHNNLPAMLLESSKPPTDFELGVTGGLYCIDGLKNFSTAFAAEWALALDSLAFTCTYGKKNCLTDQMYSGPLSLGKIAGLVWGKVSEGVFRC